MNLVVLCVEGMPKSNATHFFFSPISYSRILKIQNFDGTLVYILTFNKLSMLFYSFAPAWNEVI